MSSTFVIHQVVLMSLLLCIYYASGQLVLSTGIKVNYTRKINHFAIFFLPLALDLVFTYQKSTSTKVVALLVGISSLAIFVKPLRERIRAAGVMFVSFDRPEDRPHTLLWLTTQYLAAAVVIIPLVAYLSSIGQAKLALIPVLINGLGDGLAEPVGVRFGRTKYRTRALFSDKLYVRSIEGSLCVFAFGVLSIVALRQSFTTPQFVAALAIIPIATTLAEAWAPHTWDTPFIYGVGGLALVGILNFA
jgi:dolichol kinase